MRMRYSHEPAWLEPFPRRSHAVVVGGSLAGMLAARVLSDHFDDVTLIERDRYPEAPAHRAGVPQGRHVHVLLGLGLEILEGLFPGLTQGMERAGAETSDVTRDIAWMGPHGWYPRRPGDLRVLVSSRDLLDWGVRSRVVSLPNVRIRQAAEVVGLALWRNDGPRIAGVRIRSRADEFGLPSKGVSEVRANLVVVADGRNSRLPEWLDEVGYTPPVESVVDSFQGYASRFYRPPSGFEADWKSLYIEQAPPSHPRGGGIFPVEGGRWHVSLVGGDGDYPPTDESGFLEFARSLRSPALFDAIAEAEPLSPIAAHRGTGNRRRHYEALERFPDGVVVLGDAACSFNPVYGQGMTAAAIGAQELGLWLRGEVSRVGPCRGRDFQRRLARATSDAWQLSTGADYRFRNTEGPPQGRAARLAGGYIDQVMRASTRLAGVRQRLMEVLQLRRPPSSLFGPAVLSHLAWDRLATLVGAGWRSGSSRREASSRPVRELIAGATPGPVLGRPAVGPSRDGGRI